MCSRHNIYILFFDSFDMARRGSLLEKCFLSVSIALSFMFLSVLVNAGSENAIIYLNSLNVTNNGLFATPAGFLNATSSEGLLVISLDSLSDEYVLKYSFIKKGVSFPGLLNGESDAVRDFYALFGEYILLNESGEPYYPQIGGTTGITGNAISEQNEVANKNIIQQAIRYVANAFKKITGLAVGAENADEQLNISAHEGFIAFCDESGCTTLPTLLDENGTLFQLGLWEQNKSGKLSFKYKAVSGNYSEERG